ncbi:hypothetical protein F66182_2676 [Fusarium sp. NRRL 66182]|nr:hypothetical protein F66182_2676 [Fusarium sp. NRRL 66182]
MGFTTGFTGGVTLTLSLAYLSVLAHQRTREQQGQALRAQALALQGLVDPLPPLPPPTRSEVAAAQRAQTVEVAKDRWNTEVENAVRWVQRTDWVQVREGLEDTALRIWHRAFGGSPSEAIDQAGNKIKEAEQKVKPIVREEVAKLGDTSGKVAAAAKSAYQKAKAESKEFAHVALDHSKDKENVDIAQEDGSLSVLTPVERALKQRYDKPEEKVNKTVEDALKERYTPMDARDNTQLRGVNSTPWSMCLLFWCAGSFPNGRYESPKKKKKKKSKPSRKHKYSSRVSTGPAVTEWLGDVQEDPEPEPPAPAPAPAPETQAPETQAPETPAPETQVEAANNGKSTDSSVFIHETENRGKNRPRTEPQSGPASQTSTACKDDPKPVTTFAESEPVEEWATTNAKTPVTRGFSNKPRVHKYGGCYPEKRLRHGRASG